jgi:FHS family L-fucose permease-like MFS transporter
MMALHCMIGFLTCLNDILVPHLKAVFTLNYTQTMLIQCTFFTAYFLVSLPAGMVISAVGYKRAIVVGLLTAVVGALLFYPASSLLVYGLFLCALFTLASGFTILQVAVNPYVAVLGKPETASSRLTLTQAFNSLGTTIAPSIGGLFILSASVLSADALAAMSTTERESYRLAEAASVQMPYLAVAVVLLVLALTIYSLKLPALATVEDHKHTTLSKGLLQAFGVRRVRLAAFGIFAYVGAEVALGSFLIFFATTLLGNAGQRVTEQEATRYVALYWGGAMLGRFLGSALLARIQPARLLGVYALCAMALVALGIGSSGMVALVAVVAVGLCNSIMFPTIFTLGIHGLGRLTGYASSIITMAIVGGALVPVAQGVLADAVGVQRAFVLPVVCYGYIVWFAAKGWQAEDTGITPTEQG